jgi:hypothetical protein
MSTKSYTLALQAGVTAQLPAGTIFLIAAAVAALSIVATSLGNATEDTELTGVGAGFKYKAASGDGWDLLNVTSATAQSVTIIVGDDDVSFSNAVTVTGVAVVQALPSSTISDLPAVVTGAGTGALIAANPSRRRVRVFANPANTGTVFIRKTGGANDVAFVQPGTDETFETTAGLDYDSTAAGAGQSLNLFEES